MNPTTEEIAAFCDNLKNRLNDAAARGMAITLDSKSDMDRVGSGDGYGRLVDYYYQGNTWIVRVGRPAAKQRAKDEARVIMENRGEVPIQADVPEIANFGESLLRSAYRDWHGAELQRKVASLGVPRHLIEAKGPGSGYSGQAILQHVAGILNGPITTSWDCPTTDIVAEIQKLKDQPKPAEECCSDEPICVKASD